MLSLINKQSRDYATWAIRLYAIVILLLVGLTYFFIDRGAHIDELGLYNPIYMYLNFGEMTYPVHGQPNVMTVHPPIHYLIIAWFMKFGISLYYAELMPVFVITCIIVIAIEQGQFPHTIKFGLLTGLFSGVILISALIDTPAASNFVYSIVYSKNFLYGIRPDLHLALSWFAGLIILESARLENWNSQKLFLGSLILSYTSGLHYYGLPAFTGALIYAIWIWRTLDPKLARTKLLAIAFGLLLFGVPYLILFAIPYWQDIYSIAKAVQEAGGFWQPLQRHFEMYSIWRQNFIINPQLSLLYLAPILWLKIPAILFTTIILVAYSHTRGMAFASLPLPLFVLLYSQGKSIGYYLPELILYSCSIVIIITDLLTKIIHRTFSLYRSNLFLLSIITAFSIILIHSWFSAFNGLIAIKPHIHEMQLARAAGQAIVGSNGLVGGRLGLWYASGAQQWYDISPDLLWNRDISKVNLNQYFARFDAIAEHNHMSNVTLNERKQALSSWYLDKTLHLKGFYFAQSHSNLSYLLLNSQPQASVQGYGLRKGQLYHFQQQEQGNYIFASMVCPFDVMRDNDLLKADFFNSLFPPDREGSSFPTQTALRTFIISRSRYEEQYSLLTQCQIRDEIIGSLNPLDQQPFIDSLRKDAPMHFYSTFDEVEANGILKQGVLRSIPTSWHHWKQANPNVQISLDKSQDLLNIKTNVSTYDFQLVSAPIQVEKTATYIVQFDVKTQVGGFGFHVLDRNVQDVIASKYWCDARSGDDFQTKKFIVNSAKHNVISLAISNCAKQPDSSNFSLKNLQILRVRASESLAR